jgi:hypothetical protein
VCCLVAGRQSRLSCEATERERDREPTRENEFADAVSALWTTGGAGVDNGRHGKDAFGATE